MAGLLTTYRSGLHKMNAFIRVTLSDGDASSSNDMHVGKRPGVKFCSACDPFGLGNSGVQVEPPGDDEGCIGSVRVSRRVRYSDGSGELCSR